MSHKCSHCRGIHVCFVNLTVLVSLPGPLGLPRPEGLVLTGSICPYAPYSLIFSSKCHAAFEVVELTWTNIAKPM